MTVFVFSYILFSILPTICDIIIAIIYFVSYFSVWFGLIVFTCMVLYLSKSVYVTFNISLTWQASIQVDFITESFLLALKQQVVLEKMQGRMDGNGLCHYGNHFLCHNNGLVMR